MSDVSLTFIGGGNMATSIIGGLIAKNYDAKKIIACDPLTENLERLQQQFNIQTSADNTVGAVQADAIILAVKPQVMRSVCEPLREHLGHRPIVISIAAGITTAQLSAWLGEQLAIVRCMPNTPALVQCGASGLFANANTDDRQKALADRILGAVGIVEWLSDEDLLDAVTAVSGSGPAYFFLLMEAMIAAGVKQGLSEDTAQHLTLQTCLGAGLLAQNSDVGVGELRRRVTSPGGTTQQAIKVFEQHNFQNIVDAAMQACADRAVEMAKDG